MKLRNLAAALSIAFGFASANAHAAINGWFDMINVSLVDTAYGWICDSASPNTAPSGSLVVYRAGSYYGEYSVSSFWGGYRPDVPAAGYCGSNQYTGFSFSGWFSTDTSPGTEIYYKFLDNSTQYIGGSGKVCTQIGNCY